MNKSPLIFSVCRAEHLNGTLSHDRLQLFDFALKQIESTDEVLDVGCGDGEFARRRGTGKTVLLDGNEASCDLLRKEFGDVYHSVLPELPFSDQSFDVIHCSHVIEHLAPEELYRFLSESDRCLRPGGKLILSYPLLWHGFYRDLSHVKPYDGEAIMKYLTQTGNETILTRKSVSTDYQVSARLIRYAPKPEQIYVCRNNRLGTVVVRKILNGLSRFLQHAGICRVSSTGETIVLVKDRGLHPNGVRDHS